MSKKLIIIIAGVAFLLLWAGVLVGLNHVRLSRNQGHSGNTSQTSNNPNNGNNQTGSNGSSAGGGGAANSIAPTNSAPGGSFGPSDSHKAKLPTAG